MQGGLRLSEKWGLNGTNLVCPICGEPQGFSYLGQIDEEDSQAPKYTFTDPCDKCQSILNADGVFFIEIVSETNDIRTGRVGVLSLEEAEKIFGKGISRVNLLDYPRYTKIFDNE